MKKFKKVIAVLAALLIVSRIVLMGVSAAMVGAGVMVGIVAILAAALVASGQYTEAQVDGMSRNEIVWSVKNGIDNGTIDPKKKFPNPDKNTVGTLSTLSLVDAFTNSEVYNNWKDGVDIIDNAIDDWFCDFFNDYEQLSDDYVNPTAKDDMWPYETKGFGALLVISNINYPERVNLYYCDYYVIFRYSSGYKEYDSNTVTRNGQEWRYYPKTNSYEKGSEYQGSNRSSYGWTGNLGQFYTSEGNVYNFYGDVRYEDGTPVNPAETEYVLGETEDGTKITVDMLTPDANVKLDRVTGEVLDPSTPITPDVVVQNPSDYINIDYYTDPAVIDLLQQILNALDNANVAAPDDTKDIVDEIEGTVSIDVPEELTDYVVPTGISSVFPFCIPIDVYRGFKLLSRPAVAPKFEIPFKIPAFGLFEGYEDKVVLDFSEYDEYIKIFRWFQIIGFGFLLCSVTFKLVKGA